MLGLFDKSRIVAGPGFNRWRVPPASVAIHLCIGSVYAWSIFNIPLTRTRGVIAGAAGDWTLTEVARTFVIAIVFLGLSAAVAGKWLERVGPRVVGTVAALCSGGGFLIGAAGIASHQLWLLYFGYGVIGGCGLGLGYVSPVSTLIRWFPDRRGMAAGLAIMGFGGGSIIAVPLNQRLLDAFYKPPEYLGTVEAVKPTTRDGKWSAEVEGRQVAVVVVSAKELGDARHGEREGVYLVGTGRVGAVQTFCVLGLAYFAIILVAAFAYRIPAADWQPPAMNVAATNAAASRMRARVAPPSVDVGHAVRTPQFYLLWVVLCVNVTAGIGVLSVARTMAKEMLGATFPTIVTVAFVNFFVLAIGVFNMLGRFGWAGASDYLGRRRTYAVFFALGAALYVSIPFIVDRAGVTLSPVWLWTFFAAMMLIFTMYGGGFATIPAYLSDLFGTRNVGAIHGRLLTAWSVAGILGPEATTALRRQAEQRAVHELAATIESAKFEAAFRAPVGQLDQLVANNTVNIAKLLELAPPGTVDPTRSLYDTMLFLMAGLLVIGFVANYLVRPLRTDEASTR